MSFRLDLLQFLGTLLIFELIYLLIFELILKLLLRCRHLQHQRLHQCLQEPVPVLDGDIMHAVERVYPFVAQDAGYYSAWGLTDAFARLEITNLNYMLRDIHQKFFENYSIHDRRHMLSLIACSGLGKQGYSLLYLFKEKMRKVLPGSVWRFLQRMKRY